MRWTLPPLHQSNVCLTCVRSAVVLEGSGLTLGLVEEGELCVDGGAGDEGTNARGTISRYLFLVYVVY